MPLVETALTAIVQKAFTYALDQGQNKVVGWAQDKLGLEPRQQAFKRALDKAYKQFEKHYPQWTADLFDASFLEHEGAFVLAQFLVRDGHPDPSALALRWADSLNMHNRERRTTLVRELEPAATDFLQYMTSALKAEAELSELNDSRAFEQLASDLKAIRRKLDAEQATPGTRWDYLHWLIERTLYLDPRGTFQTQRQVLVKLDEVYIALRAQRDQTPGEVDRRLLEQELAQLETEVVRATLSAEEVEDQREHLLAHIENRLADAKIVPGEVMELAEAVNRHERLVILGDPGSGKSTLLRYLALKHAQALYTGRSEAGADLGTVLFPILIHIADYAEHGLPRGQSLSSYLADYYALHECPTFGLADLLATELAEGKCLALLDGLDEIVNADDRRKVVERIEDFIRYHGNRPNHFVITSRIAGYRSAPLGDPFVHYTVQEMDEAQIRRFLERWCTAVEAAQAPDLSQETRDAVARREIDGIMKAVQISPGVRRLAANPLLLRTLALIHRTSAQLPQKRIELYKLAADTLARTWRTAQGVPESALADERYLTRLLGRLAFWLHEHKSTGIATEQEVYRELGQEWARIKGQAWEEDNPDIESEVKKFLRAVREHTGLFVERAPKRYGFMHLTFEEYYAARYLVARSKDRAQLIRQHLHKPRWEEPILLALGFVGLDSPEDAADLLETAIMAQGEEAKELAFFPSPYENLLGQDYLFALRCLGDNIPARPTLLKQVMERLAGELLHHTAPARFSRFREALNERLSYLGASEVASVLLSRLITALHDSEADVRFYAAESLGQLGQASSEVVAALVAALHDSDADVRLTAALSLRRLGQASPEVVAGLVAALHDSDADVRVNAAAGLAQLGQASPEVVAALVAALHDSDADVRSNAAAGLAQLGQASPEVVAALVAALHDSDYAVRLTVAGSLGRLGQAFPEAFAALVAALHDSNADVRSNAAWGLGQLGQASPEVVAMLVAALHDSDARVRSNAAESLGRLGQASPEVVAALVAALHDSDADVCSNAAAGLGQLGQASPEVINKLCEAVQEAGEYAIRRRDAAQQLGRIGQGDNVVIDALWRGLLAEDDGVRSASAQALAQIGRRNTAIAELIEKRFVEAIHDPKFEQSDQYGHRPAYDRAYGGLWSLVVSSEIEGK